MTHDLGLAGDKEQLEVISCQTASIVDTSVLPVLSSKYPPCCVCHGRSSGMHFGVVTCEPCKGHFIRYLSRRAFPKCKYVNKCTIVHGQRMCAACRFKKCLSVGMSRNRIKLGRSNYIQVTQAIEEVKWLELQLKMRHDGTLISPEEHLAQLDSICDKIAATHLTYCPHSDQFYRQVHQQEKIFLDRLDIEDQLFGKRAVMKRSEYNEIYNQTKLDVDGRRAVVEALAPLMQDNVDNFEKFVEAIPGFTRLSHNDQITMIRCGLTGAVGAMYTYMYNTDSSILVYPYDTSIVMRVEHIFGFTDKPTELTDTITKNLVKLQALELTVEETAVMAALLFTIADADLSFVGRRIVNSIADNLAEALYRMLQQNHDDSERVYAKLLLIVYDMRQIQQDVNLYMQNLAIDCQDMDLPKQFVGLYDNVQNVAS